MNDREHFLQIVHDNDIKISSTQLEMCDAYVQNLIKWQRHINLVGASTLKNPYTRHVLDALQLTHAVPRGTILDVGSGGGVPGLVWAMFLNNPIYLCERIGKKATFLKSMVRDLGLEDRCKVIHDDVTNVKMAFDIITARAVTNLDEFLRLTTQQRKPDTLYIVLKGVAGDDEVLTAHEKWSFDYEVSHSLVNKRSKNFFITNIVSK